MEDRRLRRAIKHAVPRGTRISNAAVDAIVHGVRKTLETAALTSSSSLLLEQHVRSAMDGFGTWRGTWRGRSPTCVDLADQSMSKSQVQPATPTPEYVHTAGKSKSTSMQDAAKSGPVDADAPTVTSCVVCLDAPRTRAFVPCAHLVACETCALRMSQCPICRAPVASMQRIFFS